MGRKSYRERPCHRTATLCGRQWSNPWWSPYLVTFGEQSLPAIVLRVTRSTFKDFLALDIQVGTVVQCEPNTTARDDALCLWIDLGGAHPVQSSARITDVYQPGELVGTQVIVVNGFEPMRVGGFRSDVLVLGVVTDGGVVLLRPDSPVDPGSSVA